MGKKTKKTKAKPVSLGAFLGADTNNGGSAMVIPKYSWSEEGDEFDDSYKATETIVLPTAPRQSRGTTVDLDRIPNSAPFIAYVGNLPFDVEDDDIIRFFNGIEVKSIRLPREGADYGRFKGFGYVEFETKSDLIDALALSEETLKNRKIRVDIAEEEGGGNRRGGPRGGHREDKEEREDRSGGVSDWRAASKPTSFGDRGYDRGSNYGRSGSDSKPDDGYGRDRYGDRDRGYRDRRDNDRGNNRFGSSRFESRGGGRFGDSDGGDQWRRGGGNRSEVSDRPRERPRLNLEPRSKPKVEETVDEPATSKSSIFGSAKPVNTAARLREIEMKLTTNEEPPVEAPPKREAPAAKDIFGNAKPVDTASREKEIEAKLQKQDVQGSKIIKKERKELPRKPENTEPLNKESLKPRKKSEEKTKDKPVVLDVANKFADLGVEDADDED